MSLGPHPCRFRSSSSTCRVRTGFLLAICALIGVGRDARAADHDAPAQALRFPGLGDHRWSITTTSADTQAFFDQGIAFLYAFNHDEAIRSFRQATTFDPAAAMPYWGIALANGPNINNPLVDAAHATAAWESLQAAQSRVANASPLERALIEAVSRRYALPQPEDRRPLDLAYASAMRDVWRAYPRHADVGGLYAEALMNLRPWDYWKTPRELHPDADELLPTLETVLGFAAEHPLALHLYIHAVEASDRPERALDAANRLRELQPGLGHMVHMPSHIDVRLGRWSESIIANEKAIAADRAYRQLVPEQGFYRTYMAHNHHLLAYAAMMQGRSARATQAVTDMLAEIPSEFIERHAPLVDGFFAMPYELMIRFGRWDDLLAAPEPVASLPIARAMRLYGRGVARAAQGNPQAARGEQTAFRAAVDQVAPEALFTLNKATDVLAIADALLEGEIRYREGAVDAAVGQLRLAVDREDQLRYIEPPDWVQPTRHVLGATLMHARRYQEAEQVYRKDLAKHPENGWSLLGLSDALRAQGRLEEARPIRDRFQRAWSAADMTPWSSCLCLPGTSANERIP